MIEIAKINLLIMSILVLAGGVMGFVKGKSKPSLIAGTITAVLFAISYCVALSNPNAGLIAGDAVTFLLFVISSIRFRKTKKFMPGGFLLILCCLTLAVVTLALVRS